MELNREQIIKALECCTSEKGCTGCPRFLSLMGCSRQNMIDALTLIKELTEENERLRAELTGANKDKQILFDEISSLEDEAEKAIDIAESNIRAEIASGGTSCHWCEDKVKADTVRKMQSEIEARCLKGGIYPAFVKSTIDQIAKEMLEEGK